MFLLEQQYVEQQYDLNAKFFPTINFQISLFIQGGSLSSQVIFSGGIKLWIMLSSVLVKKETLSSTLTLERALNQSNRSIALLMSSAFALL